MGTSKDIIQSTKLPDLSLDFDNFIREPEKKVKSLVRKITHSGELDLNKEDLSELKKICKGSNDYILVEVFKEWNKCVRKNHSQVRVSCVKLIDYLFGKSHVIRQKLLDNFDSFLELSMAITQRPKCKLKLPPPKKYASLLQELSAKAIHKWHAEFGEGYEKLRYAYKFLKEHRLVDFNQFQVNTHEKLLKQQKLAEQQEKILTRNIENRLRELGELKPEIEQILAQLESLIDMLVPSNDLGTDPHQHCETEAIISTDIHQRSHGIANLSQCLQVEFSPYVEIEKTTDNKDLVLNLIELKKELTGTKLVKLIAIEKTISKRSEQLVNKLKDIIELKNRSLNVVLKIGELKLVQDSGVECDKSYRSLDNVDSDSDDDEEFQDVEPKEDLETYIPKGMRYEYGLEPIDSRELNETNRKLRLNDESFDIEAGPSSIMSDNRAIVLSCNVRLESGKLCPRRDKVNCPFHGRIIPRDHNGVPLNEDDRLEEERRMKHKRATVPEWQDPQLLAEIKAATGIDLKMPVKRSKGSPRKNLANTKICDLTPKKRLQKRLKQLVK